MRKVNRADLNVKRERRAEFAWQMAADVFGHRGWELIVHTLTELAIMRFLVEAASTPGDNWRRPGDVLSGILPDITERRYDLSRQYAHVVAELNFGERR